MAKIGPFKSTVRAEGRIIAGTIASDGQFKFVVFLHTYQANKKYCRAVCTGSIISSNFILTAAHCLQGYGKTKLN